VRELQGVIINLAFTEDFLIYRIKEELKMKRKKFKKIQKSYCIFGKSMIL